MWDKFRKALPKIAAALSAVKAWGGALLEGKGLDNAGMIAEEKYKDALRSNRFRRGISQVVDIAQETLQGLGAELGLIADNTRQSHDRLAQSAQEKAEEMVRNKKLRQKQDERRVIGAKARNKVRAKHELNPSSKDNALLKAASKDKKSWVEIVENYGTASSPKIKK